MEFSDYGLAMDSWKVEEECAPRDPQCSGANAQRLKDVVGQHGDVTGKNFNKGGDREISSNDLPLHRPEHSMAIKTQERNCTDVVLDNAYLDPGVQQSDLNHVEEDPDQVEEILLLFSDSDSDASEGCVKLEEECVDIDDSPDEDQGEVIPQFHHLPMPVPTTSVTPVRSPLQKKFPHLCLPSSHPLHLLEPVGDFQPRSQLVAALTELGITSKAAIKALFWTGNLCVQTAADWCFSNPGRELLSLEEEVQMWVRDLEIQEEDLTRWEEVVREWRMEEEAKAWQAAQVKRLMEQAEANRGIEMFRAMQNKATLVEVVDISGKEEITRVEGGQSAIVGPKVLYSREVVMDISDDSEEDYLFIPRVVLFVNSEAWFAVCDDVANNDLITQLYQEAENVESCAEGLMLWIDAGMSYEIRLVKDEEALLEKREVVTCNLEEEDTAWVEKWVGGEGSHSVRTFVAFALMGESEDLEDIVDDTSFFGTGTLG